MLQQLFTVGSGEIESLCYNVSGFMYGLGYLAENRGEKRCILLWLV